MPKLQKDSLVEIKGFVMLKGLGQHQFKIIDIIDINGAPVYKFQKVNKDGKMSKTIVQHYVKDTDPWVNTGNANQIVIL